jgi:pilus assembly protein CpaE
MGNNVRFIVLNRDERFSSELRALLLKSTDVKIVAEVDEPAMLAQAVAQFPADIVLVNLDPSPEAVLPVMGEAAGANPDVAIFATSDSTDGPLILNAIRMGAREFLPKPIDAEALDEAVQKVAIRRGASRIHGKLITVMGASGGVGATTFSTNLAVELAAIATGQVTVVDLDYRFGQVATVLDVEPTYTLSDLCESPEHLESQVIERALVKHDTGVHVLSRPSSFAEADTMTAASCVGLLSTLLQLNEYVVVDGPSRFDLRAKSVLDISDVNLLVLQLLVPSVRSASRILDGMREAGHNLARTRLISNRVGRDAVYLSIADVAQTLGLEAFATVPDDWSTVSGAINLGEPLMVHSPKSRVRLAIQEIAERLHAAEPHTDDKEARKKGLIGRIFATN